MRFAVIFYAEKSNITPRIVFGPFVTRKQAATFIMADIEAAKKFMDEHGYAYSSVDEFPYGLGYGLSGFGAWGIQEQIDPFGQDKFPEHCTNF